MTNRATHAELLEQRIAEFMKEKWVMSVEMTDARF